MIDMKDLENMQLVLRISGAVEESNLVKFEEDALNVLANIKRQLETDEDFSEAEQNIKSCKLIADRIATARNTALNQTKAISEVISITSRVEAKFDEVRLALTKLVGTEKTRRKDEVMAAAKKRLSDSLSSSPVKHGFVIDQTSIAFAAKNKRSLKNLEESVNEVIDAEILRLAGMEVSFAANIVKIEESEAEWPGLFHDRQNIALSAPETVSAMIVGRVADHRLRIAEKARKEQEDAERKRKEEESRAEAARLAEVEAEKLVLAKLSDSTIETTPHPVTTPEPFVPEPPQATFPTIPVPKWQPEYIVTVRLTSNFIDLVVQKIEMIHGVKSVKYEAV